MTTEEKAKELYIRYSNFLAFSIYDFKMQHEAAKQCTLIAVDEIIKQWDYIDTYLADFGGKFNPNLKYWQQVKEEIEKL